MVSIMVVVPIQKELRIPAMVELSEIVKLIPLLVILYETMSGLAPATGIR